MKSIYQALKDKFGKYPIRVCRYSHECDVCEEKIAMGEKYYDGGYGRRAHWDCVNPTFI